MTDLRMVKVIPWLDPSTGSLGIDPRSLYAETFWLPRLGPTALWVLRHLAWAFDRMEDRGAPFLVLDLADVGRAVGVGRRNRVEAVKRLEFFGFLEEQSETQVRVRRVMPRLSCRDVASLPGFLRARHAVWVEGQAEQPHPAA